MDCIVYSPNKYRETEGIKDLGEKYWNKGKTREIKAGVVPGMKFAVKLAMEPLSIWK